MPSTSLACVQQLKDHYCRREENAVVRNGSHAIINAPPCHIFTSCTSTCDRLLGENGGSRSHFDLHLHEFSILSSILVRNKVQIEINQKLFICVVNKFLIKENSYW